MPSNTNFSNWQEAKEVIENIVDAISQFRHIAQSLSVQKTTRHQIQKQLNQTRKDNAQLLN